MSTLGEKYVAKLKNYVDIEKLAPEEFGKLVNACFEGLALDYLIGNPDVKNASIWANCFISVWKPQWHTASTRESELRSKFEAVALDPKLTQTLDDVTRLRLLWMLLQSNYSLSLDSKDLKKLGDIHSVLRRFQNWDELPSAAKCAIYRQFEPVLGKKWLANVDVDSLPETYYVDDSIEIHWYEEIEDLFIYAKSTFPTWLKYSRVCDKFDWEPLIKSPERIKWDECEEKDILRMTKQDPRIARIIPEDTLKTLSDDAKSTIKKRSKQKFLGRRVWIRRAIFSFFLLRAQHAIDYLQKAYMVSHYKRSGTIKGFSKFVFRTCSLLFVGFAILAGMPGWGRFFDENGSIGNASFALYGIYLLSIVLTGDWLRHEKIKFVLLTLISSAGAAGLSMGGGVQGMIIGGFSYALLFLMTTYFMRCLVVQMIGGTLMFVLFGALIGMSTVPVPYITTCGVPISVIGLAYAILVIVFLKMILGNFIGLFGAFPGYHYGSIKDFLKGVFIIVIGFIMWIGMDVVNDVGVDNIRDTAILKKEMSQLWPRAQKVFDEQWLKGGKVVSVDQGKE